MPEKTPKIIPRKQTQVYQRCRHITPMRTPPAQQQVPDWLLPQIIHLQTQQNAFPQPPSFEQMQQEIHTLLQLPGQHQDIPCVIHYRQL